MSCPYSYRRPFVVAVHNLNNSMQVIRHEDENV